MIKYIFCIVAFITEYALPILIIINAILIIFIILLIKVTIDIKKLEKESEDDNNE